MHFSDFARGPVVIDLLVGTAGHAHAPAAAFVLVDQDDAVLLALVDGAGGAGGDAGRVEAVLAQPRQIHHEGVLELRRRFPSATPSKLLSFERLVNSPPRISSQFGPHSIFSMRSPEISERGRAVGMALHFGRGLQVSVVEGERLVIVVDLRQVRGWRRCWPGCAIWRRCAARSCRSSCGPSRRSSASGSPSPSG